MKEPAIYINVHNSLKFPIKGTFLTQQLCKLVKHLHTNKFHRVALPLEFLTFKSFKKRQICKKPLSLGANDGII